LKEEERRREGWEYNEAGELVQGILYACIKIPLCCLCMMNQRKRKKSEKRMNGSEKSRYNSIEINFEKYVKGKETGLQIYNF
jgi:hypothetical protein